MTRRRHAYPATGRGLSAALLLMLILYVPVWCVLCVCVVASSSFLLQHPSAAAILPQLQAMQHARQQQAQAQAQGTTPLLFSLHRSKALGEIKA
jgi:hypothetical protein